MPSLHSGGTATIHNIIEYYYMTKKTKKCFLHYGRHTIRACRLPDGRVIPDYKDALRVMYILAGLSNEEIANMPKLSNPNDYIAAFGLWFEDMSDDSEVEAFKKWFDEKMFGNGKRAWEGNTALAIMQRTVTNHREQVIKSMLESPDNEVVYEGNTARIYERRTGKLLATGKRIQHDKF